MLRDRAGSPAAAAELCERLDSADNERYLNTDRSVN
jgi:hypothetical protein